MDADTITITIKGVKHYFYGDALTLPHHEAIEFLKAKQEDLFLAGLHLDKVS
tara:strand:+ start:21461 stop:21616 length:156 start_codon:yes stop_codon:yes gene_type:complete